MCVGAITRDDQPPQEREKNTPLFRRPHRRLLTYRDREGGNEPAVGASDPAALSLGAAGVTPRPTGPLPGIFISGVIVGTAAVGGIRAAAARSSDPCNWAFGEGLSCPRN